MGRTRNVSSRIPRPRAKPSSRSDVSVPVSMEPKVPAMIRPHELMMPPVWATARRVPSVMPCFLLFLDHAGHEQDVVILAHGHQDHEQEETHCPVEAAPGFRAVMERAEDQFGDSQRGQVAEHDREDQVKADAGPAQQKRRGWRRHPA